MQTSEKLIQISIEGRVQGVCYRVWTKETALSLGLHGWVRNRSDGSVEALFFGRETSVTEMIRLCKEGPPNAVVDRIQVIAEKGDTSANGFIILETV